MINMKKQQAGTIIERIAEKEGISAEQVRRAMQATLDAAYGGADSAAHAQWTDLFGSEQPSIERFILQTAAHLRRS